jgi:Ran GTPase-activating protein (RanGAP) involved in mRNA processing and transport
VSKKDIKSDSVKAIGTALKSNRTLVALTMLNCRPGIEDIKIIGEALKVNKTLNLYKCELESEHIKIIAKSLNKTLEILDISWNNIGVKGAKCIAEVVKSNRILRKLNVEHYDIDIEGSKAIVQSLKVNMTLEKLTLGENDIGAENMMLISNVLQTH